MERWKDADLETQHFAVDNWRAKEHFQNAALTVKPISTGQYSFKKKANFSKAAKKLQKQNNEAI